MKKKRILVILAISVLLLVAFYFSYYFFILEDEKGEILTSLNTDNTSVELPIANVDSQEGYIQYCHFNNCNKYVYLPFENIEESSFNGLDKYKLEFKFAPYALYPWGDKEEMGNWFVKEVKEDIPLATSEEILETIKKILSDNYLWQVYITTFSSTGDNLENVYDSVKLDWAYTKSLYLLHKLSDVLEDQELESSFDREIEYLNTNATTIIEDNVETMRFPQAYILELVELGLSDEYLSFINNYEVKESFREPLNFKNNEKNALLIGEDYYTVNYRNIIYYADYYKIYSKYDYADLARYCYDQMINVYNLSDYKIYGLCSIAYSTKSLISSQELSNVLEPILNNKQTELIEGNLYELLLCQAVLKEQGGDIEEVNDTISRLVKITTSNIDKGVILAREIESKSLQSENSFTINTYHFLDLLMYLLYKHD